MFIAFVLLFFILVCSSCQLYGLPKHVSLHKIDPKTAEATQIGPSYEELDDTQLSTMDSINGIFYGISFNVSDNKSYLYGLGLETGEFVLHMELPFRDVTYVGDGQTINFDPTTGNLFVTGWINDDSHIIYRVDVSKKTLKEIATIRSLQDFSWSANEFNPSNQVLYLYFVNAASYLYLFAFDVNTGDLVKQIENDIIFDTMNYDPKTKKIIGIALRRENENSFIRTIATLDTDHNIEVVSDFKGFFVGLGSMGTYNIADREVFGIFQKDGSTYKDPYYLIVIDADTGKIKSSAICDSNDDVNKDIPKCPWNMEYKN